MKRRILSLLALAACLAQTPAPANPTGPTVMQGGAVFDSHGNLLTITNTPGAIIDWQGFSIAAGEITRFVQRDGTSAVLNRIVGQDPSLILGALQSNGRVFLVNPNGIVFGAGARVDVNGLVASALDIRNEDFVAGRRLFDAGQGPAGSVRNEGAITTPAGGEVYLIAPSVENSGIIAAPGGEVLLAAGHHVQLVDSGNPDLHVVVSAPGDRALNLGSMIAQAGTIGIYGALVDQGGVVSADSAVVGEDGRIVLRASGETRLEAGSITSARGAGQGGSIHILGDHVGITGDARVDASGERGGGTVLVGGDLHGANPDIANASATYIGADATIDADAIDAGNGGRVVVWSNDATRAYGRISARGGASAGDGGFAEVSSRGYLDYRGITDLRAPYGTAGTLLLDPSDITIQNGPVPQTNVPLGSGPPLTYGGGPGTSILTVADLEAQLAMGSVVVTTAGDAVAPNGGRITVADALGWSNSNSLTLNATSGIVINGTITAQGDGRLLLVSGGTISQTAPIDVTYLGITSLGDVNLAGATNQVSEIAAQVGDASNLNHNFAFLNGQALGVGAFSGLNGISIAVSGSYSAATPDGVIALRTTSGGITQIPGAILAAKAVYASGDFVGLTEANNVGVVAGNLTGIPFSDGFSFSSSGSLEVGTVGGVSGIQAGNANAFLAADAGDLTLTSPVAGANVSLAAAGAVSGSANATALSVIAGNGISLTTQAQSIAASNMGGSAAISITNTGALSLQAITQSGTGGISVNDSGAIDVAAGYSVSSTSGGIRIAAQGPLTVDGTVTSSGAGAITLAAGPTGSTTDQLTINGSIATVPASGVVVATGGPILLRAGDAIHVAGTIAGAVTQQPYLNTPPAPTLAQCIATPTLAGCSAVLPTLAQCTATPTLAGCSVVLPTLAQCTATPTLAGCSVVLPTLAQCTASPTLPGCSVVLPTLAQCTATPTLAGCSAVLPTLAQCTATPTLAGCSVVLPTLAQCTATPTLAGCSVVLPTLAQCAATPTRAGCSVVLPTLTQCTATPTRAGCSVVLPTLAQCTATPTLPGCSVVLPTLAQCTATPTLPGCSVVLPTLAQCTATPTLPGCSVVLPTLAQCTATPTMAGCSVVLPTLAQCTATPALAGCSVVLPTLAQCTDSPTLAGCSVVLPTLAQCTATPALAGCTVVLPTLAQCIASSTLAGCSAVLPTLAECTAMPTLAGCGVVLPTLSQCTAIPTQAGCTAVLPSVAQCAASPLLPGCSAVVPPTQTAVNSSITSATNTVIALTNQTTTVALTNQSTTGTSTNGSSSNGTSGGAGNNSSKDDHAKLYCN